MDLKNSCKKNNQRQLQRRVIFLFEIFKSDQKNNEQKIKTRINSNNPKCTIFGFVSERVVMESNLHQQEKFKENVLKK
jgi:hypothetical protein